MVPLIRQTSDRELLARTWLDYSIIQWASSEYREAHHSVSEAMEILAQERTENLYLSLAYQRVRSTYLGAFFFSGNGVRLCARSMMRSLQRTGMGISFRRTLTLARAWIQLQAMDFPGVLRTCDGMVSLIGNFTGDYLHRFSRIFAGCAEAGLGNYDRALDGLLRVRDQMNSQKIMMDWYFRMPLELALTEAWLGKKDLTRARQEAERFLNSATATAERTWRALAWEVTPEWRWLRSTLRVRRFYLQSVGNHGRL